MLEWDYLITTSNKRDSLSETTDESGAQWSGGTDTNGVLWMEALAALLNFGR